MLRITATYDDPFERVLKLEGKLLVDWVGELREACRLGGADGRRLLLDLSGLSFVDVAGTAALRDLLRQGVSIVVTSPFISELLREID